MGSALRDAVGAVDQAYKVAVSPDGSMAFVTGYSQTRTLDWDYATIAYDTSTGRQLWNRRYGGPADDLDNATDVAVSRDGSTVFVTGSSQGHEHNEDYATVAYDAATGRTLWVSRYSGPDRGYDFNTVLAVSPIGSEVFVTGSSGGSGSGSDYATVAYDGTTGEQLWVGRYDGPGNSDDYAQSIAVGPNGSTVFVTGYSPGAGTNNDYATVAYDGATGQRLWISRYDGPASQIDDAFSIAVSPDGSKAFVTGTSARSSIRYDLDYVVAVNPGRACGSLRFR